MCFRRLARKLPLPVENKETRPRIDLIVFIVNLLSERSLQSVESSLAHLHSDCFLGKVCFLVTDGELRATFNNCKCAHTHFCRCVLRRVTLSVSQTADGVNAAAVRLQNILTVSAGMSPIATTALYLSSLTRCSVTSDLEED
ncbi:centromere protein M [Sinocyclocheilus rhinocerous]|uniref:centromere protein M n=1 Tax=Sinocyclocheilus rhinocerous TaxID=307959 RepID=UPI0007B99148|nr:PREDICTED: centromere protein M [Sinocyclocheilus rhinocerous]